MEIYWILNCLAACLISVLLGGILIPQILLISFRKKLLDVPDSRKVHKAAVPRLGGLAFMPVVGFTFMLIFGFNVKLFPNMITWMQGEPIMTLPFVSCALLLLYITGMADDLVGVRYRAKFVIQVICGMLMVCGGVWMQDWSGLFGINDVSPWIGMPITVLVTVFIINAINLIDGIDGLASGLSSIACLSYGIIYFLAGEYVYAILSFAMVGVLIQFFYYNVFGHAEKRKKIFMGDTGSMTIGMMIAFLSVHILMLTECPGGMNVNLFILAFSPLIVPCFDGVRVCCERIIDNCNPFMPDQRHIHHKLLALGMSQHMAMLTILGLSLALTVGNVVASQWLNINALFLLDIVVWTIVMFMIKRYKDYMRR